MHELPQQVLQYIRRYGLLKAGDRVGVAVSGGADSVGLLRLLSELRPKLGIVISVVHFNHKLRGSAADADERFVRELAEHHRLEFHCGNADVRAQAREKHVSVETAARAARYEYFRNLLHEGRVNRIATAHTIDDQAETVLLKAVRGAGTRGLAGVYPRLSVAGATKSRKSGTQERGAIVRPLLATRREDLEAYLNAIGQAWRYDRSNRDLRHARNRVRHGILPRLKRSLNPAVREALAETAEIARAEEDYWSREVARIWPQVAISRSLGTYKALKLAALRALPLALRRRVVRAVAESLGLRLDFVHVEEVLALASGQSVVLPWGWTVTCAKDQLRFGPQGAASVEAADYDYPLPIPGQVDVPEVGFTFEVRLVPTDGKREYNPEHLLDCRLAQRGLHLRNWRAGDRFWPAHSRSPKKVKELLQERHVHGPERKLWPVVVCGEEVVWLRGFPVSARFRFPDGVKEAMLIRELPLSAQ